MGALKIKRYPVGSVKKFKARFCARGDCQKEGMDFFETLIYGKTESTIDKFIDDMMTKGITLYKDGIAKGYLGVDIKCKGETITFTQEGLTKCIINSIGLDTKYSTAKEIPAAQKALGKDINSPPAKGDIN